MKWSIIALFLAFPVVSVAQIGPPVPPPGGGGGPITAIPGPDGNLQQSDSQGNSLPIGAVVTDGIVQFTCLAPLNELELHVEVQQTYDEAFTNVATVTSLPVSQGQTAVASFTLPDVFPLRMHWQAWWKDVITGDISIKVAFGNNPESDPDFRTADIGPGGLIYRETFLTEGYPSGWAFAIVLPTPVVWRADATPASVPGGPAKSEPYSLNYNDGVDYYDGGVNAAWARSPIIELSGTADPQLTFWCNYETDTTGALTDQRTVSVEDDMTGTVHVLVQLSTDIGDCDQMGTWHKHTLTLDSSWGPVVLRFNFDTIDSWNNQYGGWFIDDIEIRDNPPLELDPASLQQLDVEGNPVPVGGVIDGGPVTFTGSVKMLNGNPLRLEIEFQRPGIAFTGTPSYEGNFFSSTPDMHVVVTNLASGDYQWQARISDSSGAVSNWLDFGSNSSSEYDFRWGSVHASPPEDDEEDPVSIACWGSIVSKPRGTEIFLLIWGFALLLAVRVRQT